MSLRSALKDDARASARALSVAVVSLVDRSSLLQPQGSSPELVLQSALQRSGLQGL
jgi:hypothetical protein